MVLIEHQIETVRSKLLKLAAQHGYRMTHPEVVRVSQQLDKLCNSWQFSEKKAP